MLFIHTHLHSQSPTHTCPAYYVSKHRMPYSLNKYCVFNSLTMAHIMEYTKLSRIRCKKNSRKKGKVYKNVPYSMLEIYVYLCFIFELMFYINWHGIF